jgi:hypothetical protein
LKMQNQFWWIMVCLQWILTLLLKFGSSSPLWCFVVSRFRFIKFCLNLIMFERARCVDMSCWR